MASTRDNLTDEMNTADDKTLRLAAPWVTAEQVEAFLQYQRALVAAAEAGSPLPDAHLAGLKASGLDAGAQPRIAVVAQAFCARRLSARALRARLEALRGGSAGEQEAAGRIEKELVKLEQVTDLARRYGAESIGCLAAREEELLDAHAQVARTVAGT